MTKRPYHKPAIKEVKLTIEDTLLTACRTAPTARQTVTRVSGSQCRVCRTTYRSS